MTYEVKLEFFEGPLDLLLHLIHRNEVSITDIPIAFVTQQYLETIELMRSLNLDVAGEYLVMAAYLTHIKSRMLLPSHADPDSEEVEEDPRDELVAHLLEYKRYKEGALSLSTLNMLDSEVFTREPGDDAQDMPLAAQPIEVGLHELIAAMRGILERAGNRDLLELEPERLQVKDKIRDILDCLRTQESATFESLFEDEPTRMNILTTFLAVLEIVKLQLVRLYQDVPFGTIIVSRRVPLDYETNGDIPGASHISDYRT